MLRYAEKYTFLRYRGGDMSVLDFDWPTRVKVIFFFFFFFPLFCSPSIICIPERNLPPQLRTPLPKWSLGDTAIDSLVVFLKQFFGY